MSASPMPLSTPVRACASAGSSLPAACRLARSLDGVRRSTGRLWQAALVVSALMMGAVPVLVDAAAPVVERTRPAARPQAGKAAAGGVTRVSTRASMAPALNKASVSGKVAASRKSKVSSRAASGQEVARKRGGASATAGKTVRGARNQRLARNPGRGAAAARKTAAAASSGVALNRAQRGVAQHISRKFRVHESAVEKYVSYAYQSGRVYNLDPHLILAVMATESSFNPRAESRVGAQGLMQVHTRVHKKRFKPYGSTSLVWQPKVNILVGSSILSDYMKRYGGSERRALKAYVGAANHKHDGGYGSKVLRRRDEFLSVTVAARRGTSQAAASQARGSIDL